MKKFALIAVALCVAFMMAAPAGALEITTDGYYRAQYLGSWNVKMADKAANNAANSYGAMRLRVNNVIKVNDNLMIRTRFRALNGVWGQDPDGNAATSTGNGPGWWPSSTSASWKSAACRAAPGAPLSATTKSMPTVSNSPSRWARSPCWPSTRNRPSAMTSSPPPTPTPTSFYLRRCMEERKHERRPSGRLHQRQDQLRHDSLGTAATDAARSPTAPPTPSCPFSPASSAPSACRRKVSWNFGKAIEWVDNIPGAEGRRCQGLVLEPRRHLRLWHGLRPARLRLCQRPGKTEIRRRSVDATAGNIGDDWEKMLIMTGDTVPATNGGALGGYGNWSNGGNRDGIKLHLRRRRLQTDGKPEPRLHDRLRPGG